MAFATVTFPLWRLAPRETTMVVASALNVIASRRVAVSFDSIDWVQGFDNVTEMKVWGSIDPAYHPEVYGTTEGASRWMPYSETQQVVVSVGNGVKTISAKIRNSGGVESDTMEATFTLTSDVPHAVILWQSERRLYSSTDVFEFGWNCSRNFDTAEVRMAPTADAEREACPLLASVGSGVAGAHQWMRIPVSTILSADPQQYQAGMKIAKVFVQVGSTWYSDHNEIASALGQDF